MAKLLFKLTHVPDDEAHDIRMLLSDNAIRFYETDAGFWRVGVDAIWLSDDAQAEQAHALIRTYQAERTAQQQRTYAELVEQGKAPRLWQHFCAHPLRFMGLAAAILFVLGLTLIPFLMLMF